MNAPEVIKEMYAIGDLMVMHEYPDVRQRYLAMVAEVRKLIDMPQETASKKDQFLTLVEQADNIVRKAHDSGDWEAAYDAIFSEKISRAIRDLGMTPDWYDPDTSYEEDVCAYIVALKRKARELREEA